MPDYPKPAISTPELDESAASIADAVTITPEEYALSARQHSDLSPDEAAQVLAVAEKNEVPFETVKERKDPWFEAQNADEMAKLLKDSPKTAGWIKDPLNASLVRDDISALTRIEGMVQGWGDSIRKGFLQTKISYLRKAQEEKMSGKNSSTPFIDPSLPGVIFNPYENTDQRLAESKAALKELSKTDDSFAPVRKTLEQATFMGAASAVAGERALQGAVVGGIMGGPAGGKAGAQLGGVFGVYESTKDLEQYSALDEYLDMPGVKGNPEREKKAREIAANVGRINGTIETISDMVIFDVIGGSLKSVASKFASSQIAAKIAEKSPVAGEIFKTIASNPKYFEKMAMPKAVFEAGKQILKTMGAEVLQEWGQETATAQGSIMLETGSGNLRESASRGSAVIPDVIQSSLILGAAGGIGPMMHASRDIKQAKANVELYKAFTDEVAASKIVARSTGKAKEIFQQIAEGSPIENIYLDVESAVQILNQEGISPDEFFGQMGVLETYKEAEKTGDFIKVPSGVWASTIAGSKYRNAFDKDITINPEQPTIRQAQEKGAEAKKAFDEYLSSEEITVASTEENKAKLKSDTERIMPWLKQAFEGAQKPEEMDDAKWIELQKSREDQLPMIARYYAVEAMKRGISSVQLFKQSPFTVQSEGQDKAIKVLKKSVEELKDEAGVVAQVKDEVNEGEAGSRSVYVNPDLPVGDDKTVMAIPSSFPEYFKNKGYTKSEVLNIIEKYENEMPLTDKQQDILDDLIKGKRKELQAEDDYHTKEKGRDDAGASDLNQSTLSPVPEDEGHFYSKISKLIKSNPQGKWSRAQLKGYLKGKVSQAELDSVDLESLPEKITKQEVLDHIAVAFPNIEVVVKGGVFRKLSKEEVENLITQRDAVANVIVNRGLTRDTAPADLRQRLDTLNEKIRQQVDGSPTKFSGYQIPGGENYREVLIKASYQRKQSFEDFKKQYYERFPNSTQDVREIYNSTAMIPAAGKLTAEQEPNAFRSSHWDEPNVLAHIRINDRSTPDGKKVLFIEEMQSDWAREGRDKGFVGDKQPLPIQEKDGRFFVTTDDGKTVDFAYREQAEKYANGRGDVRQHGVPKNPLLKNWQELAIKQVLKIAADENYDAIAWTTGEQQADRYDLSKQVHHIDWYKKGDNKFVHIAPLGGETITLRVDAQGLVTETAGSNASGQFSSKRIQEVIGKGIGERILAEDRGDLSGSDDLKIGGEWAKNLYDKQIPNILKKLTKQEVGAVEINTGELRTMNESIDKVKWPGGRKIISQSVSITQEIKQKILSEGQTLFQPLNPDVNLTEQVNIVDITDAPHVTTKSVKTSLNALVGEKLETATADWVLNVIPKNIRHIVYSSRQFQDRSIYAQRGIILSKIDDVLRSSVLIESGPAKEDKGVAVYHRFYVPVRIGGQVKTIRIAAIQTADQLRINEANLYDVLPEKRKAAEGYSSQSTATWDSTSTATISISDMLSGVKDTNGKSYIDTLRQGEPRRAFVQLTPDAAIINITKQSDPTSVIHELTHVWLNDMFSYVKSGQAQEAYLKDWKIVADWLEVKDDQKELTREQQEKFARAHELYLRKGEAPVKSLRTIFRKVAKWFTKVYKRAQDLNVTLAPEVKEVFDRMYSAEEEVRRADLKNDIADFKKGILPEGEGADVPKDVADLLTKIDEVREQAKEEAYQAILQKLMGEITEDKKKYLEKERERLRKDAERDVKQEVSDDVLSKVEATFAGMKAKDAATWYADQLLDKKNKARFEALAEILGFPNADELSKVVLTSVPREERINQYVEQGMTQHASLMNTDLIRIEAEKALKNSLQSDVIALESQIIDYYLKRGKMPETIKQARKAEASVIKQAAKETAEEILSGKPIDEATNFRTYVTAERNLAVKAARALKNKKWAEASKYKKQQLLNHELAREAIRLQKEAQKTREYLYVAGKATEKAPASGKMRITADANAQINAILSRYKFATAIPEVSEGSAKPLMQYIEESRESGDDVVIADWIMSGDPASTVGHLLDLKDAVESLKNQGKRENALSTGENLDEIVERFDGEIRDNLKNLKGQVYDPRAGNPHVNALSQYVYCVRNLTWIMRALDGHKVGTISKFVMSRLREARAKEKELSKKIASSVHDTWNKYYPANGNPLDAVLKRHDLMSKRIFIDDPIIKNAFPKGFTKETALMLALYQGAEVNKIRVIDSYAKEAQVQDPQTGRMFKQWVNTLEQHHVDMILNKMLDKNDWNFVQTILDLNESLWPDIAKLERERTGIAPRKKKVIPIVTPYGEYRGGYFHIEYDPKFSQKADEQQAKDNLKSVIQSSFVIPSTERGHTKKTVPHVYGRRLKLQLSTIDRHFYSVIRDLSFNETLRDIDRLFLGLRDPIISTLGRETYSQIRPSLAYIGYEKPPVTGPADILVNAARAKTTAYYLMIRATSIASQIAGIGPAMAAVGPHRYLAAVGSVLTDWSRIPFAFQSSKILSDRCETKDRDVRDAIKRLSTKNPISEAKRYGFMLQGYMDVLIAVPQWIAAYDRELVRQHDSGEQANWKDAVTVADETITSTQGSGDPIDYNSWQRGGALQKALSMFYTPFLPYAAKEIEIYERFKNEGINIKTLSDVLMFATFYITLPAVVDGLVRGAVPGDDSDPEDWIGWAASNVMGYAFSGFPVMRDAVSFITKGKSSDLRISPIETTYRSVLVPITETFGNVIMRKDIEGERIARDTFRAASLLTGVPRQVEITLGHVIDVLRGEDDFSVWKLLNKQYERR